MKLNFKILTIIIILILVISFSYIIFFTNNEDVDNKIPEITVITRDISGKIGDTITIKAEFSDNIEVTNATLYYKIMNDDKWTSKSILNGTADLILNSDKNLIYYVTVNDDAGNGPVGDPSTDGSSYYTITVHKEEDESEYIRHVLVEEGSLNSCKFCPIISQWLYELYNSDDYNFYFVTLVGLDDMAEVRLDEYKIMGYPTVFIDGGYNVIFGGGHEKSEYAQAIRDAELREVQDIQLSVEAEYDNKTENMICNVLVENKDSNTYNGRLRVYLTEKISKWSGPEGQPYHFGLLDFIIDEELSIDSNNNKTYQKNMSLSEDMDPENLMVIGAVFNAEKKQGYSDPPFNRNPFDAYYADAADGSELLEGGNLPPSVGFSLPKIGYLHIMGIPVWDYLVRKPTVLVGRAKIVAEAHDDNGIVKVEFYLNGDLVFEDEEAPYEYSFRKVKLFKRFLRKHTIEVIAYDEEGKTGTNSIELRCFFL